MNTLGENPAQKLIEDMEDVPSLPELYYRIKQEVNDPYSTINRISEVISVDQGLAVRILRLANSAFFGFPQKMETITDAVSLIGLQQVRDLSLCTMVIQMFDRIASHVVDMNSFWRHSLGCGICARVLAVHHREPNIERFFVAGLLHDLGRLLMLIEIPEVMATIFQEAKAREELTFKTERDFLSFDHADVGVALMKLWQLPEPLIESVGFHHAPIFSNGYPLETAIVHFSDILTHSMELGSSGERYIPTLSNEAWRRLGFKPSQIDQVVREVDRQFSEVVNIMLSTPKR